MVMRMAVTQGIGMESIKSTRMNIIGVHPLWIKLYQQGWSLWKVLHQLDAHYWPLDRASVGTC